MSQNGIALSQLADEIMKKYDSNADGQLDVADESFLRVDLDGVAKVESRGLLFTDTDAFSNSNGVVSREELLKFLEGFDTDHDGELTTYKSILHSIFGDGSEWAKFDKNYTEKFKYQSDK